MSDYIIKYPLDLTGNKPENLIQGEPHTLEPGLNRAAVPRYGAFYTESLLVRDTDTGQVLTVNDQYVPIMYYADPSERSGKEVCAGIVVTDGTVSNNIAIDYQVVGGDYSNITSVILELIENLNLDDREVSWGDLLGRPDAFPPAPHLHDLGDIYGFEYVVEKLESIRQAILYGDIASHDEIKAMIEDRHQKALDRAEDVRTQLIGHEDRVDNPHSVTKAQVGLGYVSNYRDATQLEAEEGLSNARFMTPNRVRQAIEHQAINPLNSHTARTDNPHSVTKAQVGLGNVSNYPDASTTEAIAGERVDRFITPKTLKDTITATVGSDLSDHINDKTNPHQVTKAQVGLGSVQNFGLSDKVSAEEGILNSGYMTPLRVKEAIAVQALQPLGTHTARTDNPHSVTKAQVGLGNVNNYLMATKAEAEAGDSLSRFMSPLRVHEAIVAVAGTALDAHKADHSNPHQVTKAQVGLSNVNNYPVASTAEAQDTTNDVTYMTPRAVDDQVGQTLTTTLNGYVQKNVAESLSLRESGNQLQAFVAGAWRTVWPPQWQ